MVSSYMELGVGVWDVCSLTKKCLKLSQRAELDYIFIIPNPSL